MYSRNIPQLCAGCEQKPKKWKITLFFAFVSFVKKKWYEINVLMKKNVSIVRSYTMMEYSLLCTWFGLSLQLSTSPNTETDFPYFYFFSLHLKINLFFLYRTNPIVRSFCCCRRCCGCCFISFTFAIKINRARITHSMFKQTSATSTQIP